MSGIQVICHTNIDGYEGARWPTKLQAIPNVGECVLERVGWGGSRPRKLMVCSVAHAEDCVYIELTKAEWMKGWDK